MTDQILDAVEYFKSFNYLDRKSVESLVSLAERYLACSGEWPKKKEKHKIVGVNECENGCAWEDEWNCVHNLGLGSWNSAIDACKLAHLKEKERLFERCSAEKIQDEIENNSSELAPHGLSESRVIRPKELATALRKMIEEEK